MRKHEKLYRIAIRIPLVALVVLTAAAFYWNPTAYRVFLPISAAVILLSLLVLMRADQALKRFAQDTGKRVEDLLAKTPTEIPMPVLVTDEKNEIVWYSEDAYQKVLGERDWYGMPVAGLLGETIPESGCFPAVIDRRDYSVYTVKGQGAHEGMHTYYLHEDTALKHDAKQYWLSRPSLFAIMIDSLDEVLQDARENERSQLIAQVEYVIEQFVSENNGFVIKTDRDKFFAVIEERYMKGIVEKRFVLLDRVRSLSGVDKLPVTLSIGVARDVSSYPDGEQAARQALDMAQGRGGDQVAVKTPNGYDFYGGLSKGIEKRTKVKTRIVATALSELIETSSNVVIMGHKFADLDSLGAAVGLLRASRQMGKSAAVAINRTKNLVGPLLERLEKNGYENSFYNPSDLFDRIDARTLLIVVDTHLEHVLESAELYHLCKNVAVIDHHRRMVGYIDNAVIFYHEPYASSASEMVTELVQYFGRQCYVTRIEAEALLAGIMLDTRNFTIRTGVRTFEAAAYLRRQGADTVEVRKMFSSTMDDYQSRSRLVSSAEIYHRCAIAINTTVSEDIKLVAPQAADELLSISGVDASFVLYEYGDTVSMSARSMGKINVQVIMEALGGGGHQTMAATQIPNISLEDARQKLLEAIESYDQHNKPQE